PREGKEAREDDGEHHLEEAEIEVRRVAVAKLDRAEVDGAGGIGCPIGHGKECPEWRLQPLMIVHDGAPTPAEYPRHRKYTQDQIAERHDGHRNRATLEPREREQRYPEQRHRLEVLP